LAPSKGGTGKRLKMAKLTFIMIKGIARTEGIREQTAAKIKLLAGPAKEIKAASRRGWRRLNGSKGTGLPQPK